MSESLIDTPNVSGKARVTRVVAAASTNATSVKAASGNVFGWQFANTAAYDVFVKFYDKASAPTVGTDTPLFTLRVKTGTNEARVDPVGIPFMLGIAFAITKLVADSDTTVVVAGDVTGMIQTM